MLVLPRNSGFQVCLYSVESAVRCDGDFETSPAFCYGTVAERREKPNDLNEDSGGEASNVLRITWVALSALVQDSLGLRSPTRITSDTTLLDTQAKRRAILRSAPSRRTTRPTSCLRSQKNVLLGL